MDESFWLIADHDSVEFYEFLIDLGLTVQTFFPSEVEYRVFPREGLLTPLKAGSETIAIGVRFFDFFRRGR